MKTRKAEKCLSVLHPDDGCGCQPTPIAHVSKEIADAFGMHGLPNTVVHDNAPAVPHTPTPWEMHEGQDYIHIYGGDHDHSGTPLAEVCESADAAFIVRACNSYTEMANAIAWIEKEIEENGQGQLPDALCSFIRKIAERE